MTSCLWIRLVIRLKQLHSNFWMPAANQFRLAALRIRSTGVAQEDGAGGRGDSTSLMLKSPFAARGTGSGSARIALHTAPLYGLSGRQGDSDHLQYAKPSWIANSSFGHSGMYTGCYPPTRFQDNSRQ